MTKGKRKSKARKATRRALHVADRTGTTFKPGGYTYWVESNIGRKAVRQAQPAD